MRMFFAYQVLVWTVVLSLGVAMGGKAFACSDPSAMEMGQGHAMDCCEERCRMETTHEAAKKACESSRSAFSTRDSLFSSKSDCVQIAEWILSVPDTRSLFYPPLSDPDDQFFGLLFPHLISRHHSTVPLYTEHQVFLI